MSDIDLTTGLPELPEDYFWRVFLATDNAENTMFVAIMRKFEALESFLKNGWFGYKTEYRMVVQVREVKSSIVYSPLPDNHHNDNKPKRMTPESIGARDIIRTAEKVMLAWENKKKVNRFLGDYPPKTLVNTKENTDD